MEEKEKHAERDGRDGRDERAGLDGGAGRDGHDGRDGGAGRDELDKQLEAFERSSAYATCSLLKESGVERTELVERGGRHYVRKYLDLSIVGDRAHPYERLEGIATPCLARVVETHRIADKLVVVSEHIPGETLTSLVGRKGALSTEEARGYVACLGRALGFLHDRPDGAIVHRDVNPDNVIVSDGKAWLVDLGIARSHVDGAAQDTTALGTAGFAAPEQYGFRQTDARTDVYALGKVLTFMLTEDENSPEALDAHTSQVVAKATALDPDARYASVEEMLADWAGDPAGSAGGVGDTGAGIGETGTRGAGADGADSARNSGRTHEDGLPGQGEGQDDAESSYDIGTESDADGTSERSDASGRGNAESITFRRPYLRRHSLWNIWQVVSGLGVVLICAYVVYGFTSGTNTGHAVSDVCILVFLLVIPWAATTNLPGVLDRIPWLDERRHFKQFVIVACSLTALLASAGFWPAGP